MLIDLIGPNYGPSDLSRPLIPITVLPRLASIPKRKRTVYRPGAIPKARINAMIEEATVDAYDLAEQTVGFFTMIEQYLASPFRTAILGQPVTVLRVDMNPDGHIVALCSTGRRRQAIPILDLPLPVPPPPGAEWIAAYRRWLKQTG
jgi:hypothetical protein